MAYDVARVRGLIPSLGDGWIHLDPQAGMQIPDAVSRTVSTAFRASASSSSGRHVSNRRSAAILECAHRGRGSGRRRSCGSRSRIRPSGVVGLARRVAQFAVGPRNRSRTLAPRRRGERRALASCGQSLRRSGAMGRGRNRNVSSRVGSSTISSPRPLDWWP